MRRVILGRIGAPHGVRGWVRIQSSARPPQSILEFDRWWIGSGDAARERRVLDAQVRSRDIVARLEGCDDRESAVALRNAEISVPVESLPEPADDEWYWHELIGLQVVTVDGAELGRIDHLLETGANDVLVVLGDRERLIPWIPDEVIREIDPEQGRMVVDWDPGF
ncbi:MAG: ribosome maturation factor RimM [Halofilum sp. (in: g-proteobacteria)]|nr:ribosome maturation factor RimM [Halofilum sp. (in: g-proteobacteria)]